MGIGVRDGGWVYPIVHSLSTAVQALFCTGCIVLVYQLCLRWFGRERLEGLMTAAQVFVAMAAVLAGQIVPRILLRPDGPISISVASWWVGLMPPAWFAGFDDALAGSGAVTSWMLAAAGLLVTTLILWLAFGKLAATMKPACRRSWKPPQQNRSNAPAAVGSTRSCTDRHCVGGCAIR